MSSMKQRIFPLAIEILGAYPDGVDYADLAIKVLDGDESLNLNTVAYYLRALAEEEPAIVHEPSRFRFRLETFRDTTAPSSTTPPRRSGMHEANGVEVEISDRDKYVRVLCALVQVTDGGETTRYAKMAAIMGITYGGQAMGSKVGSLLNKICEAEVTLGRPMLSAVVIGYRGRPGAGFYTIARRLDRMKPGEDEVSFWRDEVGAVYAAWHRPASEA